MKKTPEDIQKLLKEIRDHFGKEDTAVREYQIRKWRRLKLMWEGFSQTWFSEVAHDWRVYDENENNDSNDQDAYNKPINVFKAYLESIIAALSISIPVAKCFPDDANNPLDLATAKAGDKIGQLIYRHNDVSLLWLHALFIFCTEGMVACYSYNKEDESYGTYSSKKYEDNPETHQFLQCPNCGHQFNDQTIEQSDVITKDEKDEFDPTDEDAPLHSLIESNQELCPACMSMIDPELKTETLIVTRLVGITQEPKSRQCLEAYGGLYVKVPNYAMKQEDVPYLIFSKEVHYSKVIERYDHLYESLGGKSGYTSGGLYEPYERWGRLPLQYRGEYPTNVVTVQECWFRPCAYNILNAKVDINRLKKLYPDGVKCVFVNEEFAEACNESLDDHWTLTQNPMSDYIHHEPLGSTLVSVQEITSDLLSLIIQTIEHGIPQTFADPAVLDFNAYRQTEVAPGDIYPAKPKSGKSVSDAFYEVKTSTLSQEVLPFSNAVQQMGQLASGSTPSIFGGQLEGSNTASEYSMSRAQALQRLQNQWKLFTIFWKNIFGKVIPAYIKNVQDDERNVQKDKMGNFVNDIIRMSELQGKLGRIELEAAENLPITWSQQKDVVMAMINGGNPEVLSILGAPENLIEIREVIGIPQFFVPGEDKREFEYTVIQQLLNSEPIASIDPNTQQPNQVPSVEVDPVIDDSEIGFEIDRAWLISESGQVAKIDNPKGYTNVLLRAKMHQSINQQNAMSAQMGPVPPPNNKGAVPVKKPSGIDNKNAPMNGVSNVSTVQ